MDRGSSSSRPTPHAGMPKELWPEYLDARFHELIPKLHEDNAIYPVATAMLAAKKTTGAPFEEHREIHRTGWHGLHDPVLRLADMDREGVAAEFIFHGDFRLGDLFHNGTNRQYPLEAWDAGARAWNRWAADTFGFALDRFLLTAAVGPCVDMDAAVAEVHWIADHGFAATYGPHYMTHPDLPSLVDEYWEPYWAACAERGIAIVVHAGFGTAQGVVFKEIEKIYSTRRGSRRQYRPHGDARTCQRGHGRIGTLLLRLHEPQRRVAAPAVADDVRRRVRPPPRPQAHAHRDPRRLDPGDAAPPRRGLRRAPRRHSGEAQAERVLASQLPRRRVVHPQGRGRDAPRDRRRDDPLRPRLPAPREHVAAHPEWLRDAFAGVPEDELRLMLGENAIRFFGLDRERLAEIARRIGPTVEEINATDPHIRPELMANFAARGGYLKPSEGDDREGRGAAAPGDGGGPWSPAGGGGRGGGGAGGGSRGAPAEA